LWARAQDGIEESLFAEVLVGVGDAHEGHASGQEGGDSVHDLDEERGGEHGNDAGDQYPTGADPLFERTGRPGPVVFGGPDNPCNRLAEDLVPVGPRRARVATAASETVAG